MPTDWSDTIVLADLPEQPQLADELTAVLDRVESAGEAPPNVVLNFQNVKHLNSSHLAQMLQIRKLIKAKGRRLLLASVADEVWSVLLATGLDKLFELAPDPATALTSVQLDETGA